MSEPMVSCAVCLRKRDPHLHDNGRNAESPPTKARKWLERTCPHKDKCLPDGKPLCQIAYRAGIGPRSVVVGQQKGEM